MRPWNRRAVPVTIHDAALDGPFPADGYAQRLDRWARWIVAAASDG